MKVLVFEWLTCGGLWFDGLELDSKCPFQVQGLAMFQALTSDFLKSGHQVLCTQDCRIQLKNVACNIEPNPFLISHRGDLQPAISRLADEADAIVIIAPECDGCLNRVVHWLASQEAKLASPNATFVGLTSDKQATTDWLRQCNIPVPDGVRVGRLSDARDRVALPAIAKPNMGAGSENVFLINAWNHPDLPATTTDWRVESFVSGESLSVSVISDRQEHVVLTPTGQLFDRPLGHYVGARHPLAESVAARAKAIALATAKALPPTCGYFGIDMILGENEAWVVDVNPRLTLSYLWLREITPFNLAQKILEMASRDTAARTAQT